MALHIFTIRVISALLLGILIGAERQWRNRTAGIRTNGLVATGSALFVLLSVMVEGDTSPTRIPAQIVSGIGFLGAGVIFKEGYSISGLNTAATIWSAAAIGSLAGFGFLAPAALGTAVIVGVNTVLRFSIGANGANGANREEPFLEYQLSVLCGVAEEPHIRSVLHAMMSAEAISLRGVSREESDQDGRIAITARVMMKRNEAAKLEQIISRIGLEESVQAIHWDAA
ncbi:putative Mg2+ transporter-C (MgtC) family protein [Alkalispirochaeta americana]|uniref:Protein MgtC n=1 Tax=Alkalispirochaeta americana TaxID=159291 RepID=A0A1N6T244_9SPIO|nr:MgtC/SapB family protein [Alkalispirochaeta americana]SIQ47475.1 putative Mg2+ transporter-C (MgtC) family protein [Alkalispirochaeta americana]